MKYLKVTGLAAIAALAAMAFIGAGSASAAAICPELNGSGNCIEPRTNLAVEGDATNPFLEKSASEKITCAKSHVTATASSGTPNGTFSGVKITWSECSNTIAGCAGSATTVTSPGTYSGSFAGDGKGTIIEPATTVKMTCLGFPVECKYLPPEVPGTYSNATLLLAINAPIPSPGGVCPAGTEHANYAMKMTGESPGMFFIAKE